MIDIAVFFVFSIVMLMFMAFPAIKIVEFLETKIDLTQKQKNILTLLFTVILSLIIGAFLKYVKI